MTVGVLTGGGDCPGLNAVIRAVVRRCLQVEGCKIIGFKNGWKGVIDNDYMELDLSTTSGILPKGGTILGTSRTNPYKKQEEVDKVKSTCEEHNIDVLIAIGGEDTLGVATKLSEEGLNVVGIPKTIDNDVAATDYTFGFDTAVNILTDCVDRLHTTAESHNRIIVVEAMGRHAGWIALHAGLAGGADIILIPEIPIDTEKVCQALRDRHQKRKKTFSIVVVAEGARFKEGDIVTQDAEHDQFGHVKLGGVGQILADKIEEIMGYETRVVVPGHIQRGGSPTAFDRILGTRYGVHAAELAINKDYGKMVALRGNELVSVPLTEVGGKTRTVDMRLYKLAEIFFG